MKYGLIGPGRQGSRYLMPENGGDHISLVHRLKAEATGRHNVQTGLSEFLDVVDAAIIAAPPETHHSLVMTCLESRMPVLVEKPLALTWDECEEMIDTAERYGVPLLVAHTHLFHPAFERIVHASLEGEEQPVSRITSYAGGNGPERSYSALLDWGPHDVAMAIAVAKEGPTGSTVRELSPGTFEIGIEFPSADASIVVSNRFPQKKRLFMVEETFANKTTRHQYTGQELSPFGTPMSRMFAVFRAMAEDGLEDYRGQPNFTRAVYDVLMAIAEPKPEGDEGHHGKGEPNSVLQG